MSTRCCWRVGRSPWQCWSDASLAVNTLARLQARPSPWDHVPRVPCSSSWRRPDDPACSHHASSVWIADPSHRALRSAALPAGLPMSALSAAGFPARVDNLRPPGTSRPPGTQGLSARPSSRSAGAERRLWFLSSAPGRALAIPRPTLPDVPSSRTGHALCLLGPRHGRPRCCAASRLQRLARLHRSEAATLSQSPFEAARALAYWPQDTAPFFPSLPFDVVLWPQPSSALMASPPPGSPGRTTLGAARHRAPGRARSTNSAASAPMGWWRAPCPRFRRLVWTGPRRLISATRSPYPLSVLWRRGLRVLRPRSARHASLSAAGALLTTGAAR